MYIQSGFRLVKRPGESFAKKWSEQKVPVKDVVMLYSTYQKYRFEALTLNGFKKNGLEYF